MNETCQKCVNRNHPTTFIPTCGKCSVIGHGVSSRFEARGSVDKSGIDINKERDVLQRVVDAAYNADCERDTDGGVAEGEAAVILRDYVSSAVYGPIDELPPLPLRTASPGKFKSGIRCEVVGDGYCQGGSNDRIGKIVTLISKVKKDGTSHQLCSNVDVTCWNVIDFDGGENCFSEAGLKPIPTCGECYWWRPLDARGYVRPYFGQKPQPGKCIDENGKVFVVYRRALMDAKGSPSRSRLVRYCQGCCRRFTLRRSDAKKGGL